MAREIEEREGWFWPKDDIVTWRNLIQIYDLPKWVTQHCKQTRTVFQAGGNAGLFIKGYSEIFDNVYTCEPDYTNFVCLTLNTRDKSNVYRYQACVGKEHELLNMNVDPKHTGASFVQGAGTVPTLRIDDLNLQNVDLIALDVEGFEHNALLGAEETIRKWKPTLCVEWYQPWADRYGFSLEATEAWLAQFGYKFVTNYESDRIYVTDQQGE
jgi:FkbM family methyltransferase